MAVSGLFPIHWIWWRCVELKNIFSANRISLLSALEIYLERYRPLLLKGNLYPDLWISIRGRPMSKQAIYWNTCRLSETLFGRRINPHLFRDCSASALATDAPDHVLAAARILGHASLDTTLRHYE